MVEVWLYTVGASHNPDLLDCKVPIELDGKHIFFGPCMRRIRRNLRQLLGPNRPQHTISKDHFIVGVNAANRTKIRKIVWAGKLLVVMTFAKAHDRLVDARRHLGRQPYSPFFVKPLYEKGILVGYKHISELHEEFEKGKPHKKWVYDLSSDPEALGVRVAKDEVLVDGVSAWDGFDLDCCILLKRILFANEKERGLELDETVLPILRKEQPRKGVDAYAIFGYTKNEKVNGLRGNYLSLKGKRAHRFITWLQRSARLARKALADQLQPGIPGKGLRC